MLEQIKEYFGGLEPGPRRILIGTIFLTLLALVGVGWWSYMDRYQSGVSVGRPG